MGQVVFSCAASTSTTKYLPFNYASRQLGMNLWKFYFSSKALQFRKIPVLVQRNHFYAVSPRWTSLQTATDCVVSLVDLHLI